MPKHFDPDPIFTFNGFKADVVAEATTAAGVTVDSVLLKDGSIVTVDGGSIEVDTVNEATSANGVTIDGVLIKDSTVKTDTIIEKSSAAGVTLDSFKAKDGGFICADGATGEVDTINEATTGAGVTADGVLLKDGAVHAQLPVQTLTESGAISITNGLVLLNHATVVIAATLPAPTAGDELFIVDSSASGTAAHTVTVESGVTLDGTNDVATLNAPGEALHLVALSATRWFIVVNVGSVGLS